MPFKHMSDDEQPEVEGHGARFNGLDQHGNQFEIPEEKILSVKWTDAEGEHEVEGHIFKHSLSDEPDTEGHSLRHGGLSDQPLTIKFLDEQGEEQEVEGHLGKWGGLSDEPEVEGHRKRFI